MPSAIAPPFVMPEPQQADGARQQTQRGSAEAEEKQRQAQPASPPTTQVSLPGTE